MAFIGLLSLFCIFSYFQTQKYIFILFPFLVLVFPLLFIYPQILLFLLIISFFWGFHIWGAKYLFVSWSQILFILAILGFLSKYLFTKTKPMYYSRPVLLVLIIFIINATISFLLNFNNHPLNEVITSISYLCNFTLLIIGFVLFSSSDMKQWKSIIILLILVLSLVEIPVVIWQAMKVGKHYLDSYRDITGTFGTHHSQLANMMTFPLGFSLVKLLEKPKFRHLVWIAFLAFASLLAIIYSGSRSNLMGIAGAGIILAGLKLKLKPVHFFYLFSFSIGLFLLLKFSPLHHLVDGTIHSSDTGSLDLSSIGRLMIWKNCWADFINATLLKKLFGIGMANLMTIPIHYMLFGSNFIGGAHNIFLHVLVETGIFGFILFISYFIIILTNLYRQSSYDNLALAYFFITLSLLLSGITQEVFWFQPVFGCLWLFHTCLLSLILDNKKGSGNFDHRLSESAPIREPVKQS